MYDRIKSIFLLVRLFLQKMADILHRYLYGLPILKNSQVTADLFLGSQYNLIGLQKLKALGVTAIVNMRMHSVYSEAQYIGFKYLHLPTPDNTPPTLNNLEKGANFMDQEMKAGGKVYVHCRQGLGRGPTMAIAYLIKAGATYDDAYALVKKTRPFIAPRPAQVQRLHEFEKDCREQRTFMG